MLTPRDYQYARRAAARAGLRYIEVNPQIFRAAPLMQMVLGYLEEEDGNQCRTIIYNKFSSLLKPRNMINKKRYITRYIRLLSC